MSGSGTVFAGKSGETKKLSHSVHRELKFLKLALKIKIFEFMAIHVGFEQFCGKHSGAATIADRRVKGFLFELDIVRIDVGYGFHGFPSLWVRDLLAVTNVSNHYASWEAVDTLGQLIDIACDPDGSTNNVGELAHEI